MPNMGHVTATDVHLSVDASQQRISDGHIIGQSYHFNQSIRPIPPGTGADPFKWISPWYLTETERNEGGRWAPDWPGKRTFVFSALLTYNNGFEKAEPIKVCKKWLPGYTIHYKEQTSGGGGGLVDCSLFENTIQSTKEQEKKAENGADRPK